MNERTRDWLDRASRARSLGDSPTADWCDDQADWHMRHGDCTDGTENDDV